MTFRPSITYSMLHMRLEVTSRTDVFGTDSTTNVVNFYLSALEDTEWSASRCVGDTPEFQSVDLRKTTNMAQVIMYSSTFCPYCVMAERLLLKKGVQRIHKIMVDLEPDRREEMMEKTRRRTVPQIYIGDIYIGGYDDLAALDRLGQLDLLLTSNQEQD